MRCQSITVPHFPKTALGISQRCSDIRKAIDLVFCGLADLPIYDCKVVSINRSRTSRDSTRWPLSRVILINSNAMLRRYTRRHHFKQIELGSYLKKRTGIRFVCVQMLDVGNYFAYRYSSG